MKFANIIAAIIGIIFSSVSFIKTFSFKQFKNVPVGPEFFPRYLSAGLFLCCLALLLQNLFAKDNKTSNDDIPSIDPRNPNIKRMLLGLVIIIISSLLWHIMGFLIIAPLTLFVLMLLLGKRNYIIMVILSIGITAIVFVAFRFLLGIEMPMGFLAN